MRKFVLIFIVLPFIGFTQSTNFDADQQYDQAMSNAKLAFEAKQYSDAVMFYKEAIKIKPEALLPRYKIEDIRTIYIEKELENSPEPVAEKVKRKNKKQLEAEKVQTQKMAEEEATRKMNEDANKAAEELKNLNIAVAEIQESESDFQLNNSIKVESAEKDELANLEIKATEIKESDNDFHLENNIEIDKTVKSEDASIEIKATNIEESEEDLLIKDTDKLAELEKANEAKLSVSVVNINEDADDITNDTKIEVIEFAEIPKVESQKKQPEPLAVKKVESQAVKPKQMSAKEKEIWVEQENQRLRKVYPNKKTVEEIEKPGKHITRVIMNIDNKVTIYLKVKHSWGATFFFMDEIGQELRSINEQYFNLMTNLNTYGG